MQTKVSVQRVQNKHGKYVNSAYVDTGPQKQTDVISTQCTYFFYIPYLLSVSLSDSIRVKYACEKQALTFLCFRLSVSVQTQLAVVLLTGIFFITKRFKM